MSKYLLLGLVVVGLAVGLYVGCGPRVGVAKDAAIKKIDDLLGPLNVKQKAVEMAFDKLKKSSEGIRDKRIEAQVRLKALTDKKAEYEKEKAKSLDDLKELRTYLEEAESTGVLEREGKEDIPIEKLNLLALATKSRFMSTKDMILKNDVIASAWAKNLDLLKKNDDTSAAQLKKLSSQLDQIRSKKSALDAMKEAATIAGPGASISDKFNELTASVDELLVNIDTEFAIEEAKINDRIAEVEQDSSLTLDELLNDDTNVKGTLSEIDELLKDEDGK